MQITASTWQRILKNVKIFFFALLTAIVGLSTALGIDADPMRQSIYQRILTQIQDILILVYEFARPFVIVILLVLLVEWLLKKLGLNIKIPPIKDWNIFNVLVMLVMTSFVVSALCGWGGTAYLKDLALVVMGFYFGTFQNKKKETL